MKEIEQPLWNRGEAKKPTVDVLYTETAVLRESLEVAKKNKLLIKRKDGEYFTPVVRSRGTAMRRGVYTTYGNLEAEAHIKDDSSALYVAVGQDLSDDVTENMNQFYNISARGTAVDLDTLEPVAPDSVELAQLKIALNLLTTSTASRLEQHKREQIKRRKAKRTTAMGSAGLLLAGVGAAIAADKLLIEPGQAAEAARAAYDKTPHVIAGEGISIQPHAFTQIPASEFGAIPSYGGSDHDFLEPRRISLSKDDGCTEIPTKLPAGETLYAETPLGGEYSAYHYTAYATEDGFKLCLTEPIPAHGLDTDVPVAVQIR